MDAGRKREKARVADVQDELHEEPHESHDDEPHTGTRGDLAELLAIGLGALSDETVRILGEFLHRLNGDVGNLHGVGCVVASDQGCSTRERTGDTDDDDACVGEWEESKRRRDDRGLFDPEKRARVASQSVSVSFPGTPS